MIAAPQEKAPARACNTEPGSDREQELCTDSSVRLQAKAIDLLTPKAKTAKGVNGFPIKIPEHRKIAGNDWLRRHDIAFFNSGAGMGKSVAMGQLVMAWGLGLPYFGIPPARPLKILHFCGEDDEVTLGQIREGFLENSEALTGKALTASDLDVLDENLETDFSREFAGDAFITHLEKRLAEKPVDLVIINPLLSFIGGNIVECASDFLRGGLMPVLQDHDCTALIAHHTTKLVADSWEKMDFTYSGIGGGEVANIPRTILTLAPAKVKGLCMLHVSKRVFTGWLDGDFKFSDCFFIKRTDDPSRPAWLPVSHDDAEAIIPASKQGGAGNGGGKGKKLTTQHVTDALATGDMARLALIVFLVENYSVSDRTVKDAINDARLSGHITEYKEVPPSGGRALIWYKNKREAS